MRPPSARTLIWVAVAVGLALRGYHYLRNPPLWHDEAALVVNVLDRGFADLLGTLKHSEAAPPLFLWQERAVARAAGDSLYALRAAPFLAACAALVLFARLAERLLTAGPAALAVGLFAVADRLLWHATEAKSYSLDAFIAVLAAWWVAGTAGLPVWKRCLPAVLVVPPAIWVSYPACFVAGGLLLALLPAAWRSGWSGRGSYVLLALATGAAFVALVVGPAAAQRTAAMDECWQDHFVPYGRPLFVPVWAVVSTFEVVRYCLLPAGNALAVFAAVGLVRRWRDQPAGRPALVALVVPWGLALVAAFLHRYPYGAARVMVYATPAVCLLVATGAGAAVPWLLARWRPAAWAVVALTAVPFVNAGVRLAVPWKRGSADRAAGVVLREHRPGDATFANNWESEYYFRHLPGGHREWKDRPLTVELTDHPPASGRALAVFIARPLPDGLPGPLPPDWRVAERWEFEDAGVFLLVRDAQATNSPPE